MTAFRRWRISLTAVGILCMVAVAGLFTLGVNREFADSMLLAMKLLGAVGAAALIGNAVAAVVGFALEKGKQGPEKKS